MKKLLVRRPPNNGWDSASLVALCSTCLLIKITLIAHYTTPGNRTRNSKSGARAPLLQKARAETRTGRAGQKYTFTQKTNRKLKLKRTNEKKVCKGDFLNHVEKPNHRSTQISNLTFACKYDKLHRLTQFHT